jgi:hypothetical protein
LVVATPCPLLIGIPIAIVGSISLAARRGIVVRDPSVLERIDLCRTIILDKTGTLTYGRPALTDQLVSFWSRALRAAGDMSPAPSVTQLFGTGGMGASSARVVPSQKTLASASATTRSHDGDRTSRALELDLGGLFGAGLSTEISLVHEAAAERRREEHGGEAVAPGVELSGGLVEAHAFDGDPVLGALELRLQITEVLRRLQVRIAFDHDHQARQRGRKLRTE